MADEQTTPETESAIIELGTIIIDRYMTDGHLMYGITTDDGFGGEQTTPESLAIIEMGKLQLIAQPLEYFAAMQSEYTCDHEHDNEDNKDEDE